MDPTGKVAPDSAALSASDDKFAHIGLVPSESTDKATSEPETPAIPLRQTSYPSSPNPWTDGPTPPSEPASELPARLATPDPSQYDDSIAAGLFESPATPVIANADVSNEVLQQFDPLASLEEKAARDAWETSEGHMPPPRTPSPEAPPLPSKDLDPISQPNSPQTSVASTFPSLASLAKTFSIPALSRPRPLSMDTAKPVPSPSTLSAFASQQDQPRGEGSARSKSSSRPHTPNRSGSGTASPVLGVKGEVVFDFQQFLDQMKTRSAEPVSKYLRSFLSNFAKRTFTVNDQVRLINDFLIFISAQMRTCDVWKNLSDTEFNNAMEGMEKLVMNRLYEFTFTPQLVHANPPRPITADDLERDRVLSQRIALFGWLEEKHLDIPEEEGTKGFIMFAEQELLKINHYKAPRDKLICILNCCKVIFGLIRHLKKEEGADAFVPILIFVVLKANPQHLLSNVEFINRFRSPAKLQSEAGYYLSSLMGAVSFIETMDHTSLSSITQEEFEKNVEEAIQALPPSEPQSPAVPNPDIRPPATPNSRSSSHAGEESAQPLHLSTPAQTLSEDAKRILQKTGDTISKPLNAIGRIFSEALDGAESKLSYLPGPFAPYELGREQPSGSSSAPGSASTPVSAPWVNQEQWSPQPQQGGLHSALLTPQTPQSAGDGSYTPPLQTPYKARVKRVPSPYGSPSTPTGFAADDTPSRNGPFTQQPLTMGPSQQLYSQALIPPRVSSLAADDGSSHISRTPTPNLDLAGVEAQIDLATEQAAAANKATLLQIFPGVDGEVIEWVLEANESDLGKCIEALLEMSSGS